MLSELGNTINYANPFRRTPYNQQWQFSIQRVIGWSTMVDAGYVGSHALKLFNDYNWNERSDIWLQQGVNESNQVPNPFWGIFPATSSLGGSRNIAQGRLWYPFPQFNNVNVFGMNTNRALYHSFQFALRKRMSHGLSATVNYTYSKNMVYDGASLVNDRQWRAVASSDRPHIFRVFATYSLPFGRRRALLSRLPGWANRIVGGWEFAGSFRMTSGTPLSISQTRGRPIPLSNPVKSGPVSDRLGDKLDPATGRPSNPYFDTTAWQSAAERLRDQPRAAALFVAARAARDVHQHDRLQDVQRARSSEVRAARGSQQSAEPSHLRQPGDEHGQSGDLRHHHLGRRDAEREHFREDSVLGA